MEHEIKRTPLIDKFFEGFAGLSLGFGVSTRGVSEALGIKEARKESELNLGPIGTENFKNLPLE